MLTLCVGLEIRLDFIREHGLFSSNHRSQSSGRPRTSPSDQKAMTTLYADRQPAAQPIPSAQDGAEWVSWVRDVVFGVLGFAGMLAAVALPLALRAWLFLAN